jgi:N utilization substance protein B
MCNFAALFAKLDILLILTHMINRTLVRTKVLQTLFAFYKDGDKTPLTARKELLNSFSSTYSLYMTMLAFADELVTYAEEQIAENKQRAIITHQEYVPNYRFVQNKVSRDLFNNRRLRNYIEENHLRWDTGMNGVIAIYKQLLQAPFYQEYMQLESPTYEDDKKLWRKIYGTLLIGNEDLYSALDEMEVSLDQHGWTIDIDQILTYIVKTIKLFKEENGDEQPLLEMFDSEEELAFAKDLLRLTIENADEYRALIAKSLHNWDAERVAYMDQIILLVAISEIVNFNNIALEISMNEYIELSKEYSSDKSYQFINGVLNNVVKELQKDNVLFKVIKK